MKKLILTIAIIASAISTGAYSFTVKINNQSFYFDILPTTYRGSKCVELVASASSKGYTGVIQLPEWVEYNGQSYYLISIGDRAFYNDHDVYSVTLPNSLTHIGSEAFYLSGISTITIPSSVMTIGDRAFGFYRSNSPMAIDILYHAEMLREVTINSNAVMNGKKKLYDIFGVMVRKYIIGDEVTEIGDSAFISNGVSNEYLTSVKLSKSVKTIGKYAFYNNVALESVSIPEDSQLETISMGAFAWCTALDNVYLPQSVQSVGSSAFSRNRSLQRVVDMSSANLGSYVFDLSDCRYGVSAYIISKDKENWYKNSGFAHVYVVGGGKLDEDVNGDGDVNGLDALKVYKYMQSH